MKFFPNLITIIFSIFYCCDACAQGFGVPRLMNFTKDQYQGGAQTFEIGQFSNGIVAAANNDGLLVFDGVAWNCFKQPNQTILRSIEVVGDRVYAGGQNELGYFDFSTYPPHYVSLLDSSSQDNLGEVWSTVAIGEEIFFRADNALFVFDGKRLEKKALNSRVLGFFKVGKKDVFQADEGLMSLEGRLLMKVPQVDDRLIHFELVDSAKVFFFEKKGIVCEQPELMKRFKDLNDYLLLHELNLVKRLNGAYCFGTKRGGLVLTNTDFSNFTVLDVRNGLQRNDVSSVFQEQNGDLWVGTNNGIDYVELGASFRSIHPDGYLRGAGYAAQEFEGELYFGTGNGLFRLDRNDAGINEYLELEHSKGQVWGVKAIDDLLWVCHHEGLMSWDGQRMIKVEETKGVWEVMSVPGYKDQLLIGHYEGLSLIERKNGVWTKTKDFQELKESARIIAYEGEFVWWVSHPYIGAWRWTYDPESKTIIRIKRFGKEQGFPSDLHIYVKRVEDEMVFTAESGLYQYNKETGRIEEMLGFDDYFSEGIRFSRLFNGLDKQLWFVTENEFGVLKIEESALNKSIRKMVISELKPKLVGGFEFLYPLKDGRAIAGVDDGFVMLDLNRFTEEIGSNTGVKIRGVENIRTKEIIYSPFHGSVGKLNALEFDQEQRSLRIEYGKTSLRNQDNLRIETLLDGFESKWLRDEGEYYREFTNLKSGNYVFRVRILNEQDFVLDEEVLRFEITRPWYLSFWAWLAYALVFMISVITLYRFSAIQNEKEKEALVLQKEQELQDQKAKSGQVINELRNRRLKDEIVHKNKELASATMHLVQKAKVLQGVRDVLKQLDPSDEAQTKKEIRQIIKTINNDIKLDKTWQQFERHFDQVHVDFLKRLRETYPSLTPNDQKLCAYLRMNLTTKEIATIMNISVRGVEISRYRLRKKLELNSDVNLTEYILKL